MRSPASKPRHFYHHVHSLDADSLTVPPEVFRDIVREVEASIFVARREAAHVYAKNPLPGWRPDEYPQHDPFFYEYKPALRRRLTEIGVLGENGFVEVVPSEFSGKIPRIEEYMMSADVRISSRYGLITATVIGYDPD